MGDSLKTLLLGPPRLTLAVAESLTCGRVQAQIGRISGASTFFLGGITAYDLDAKVRLLSVDRREAERVNGVSAAVAEQMARGAARVFGSNLAIATTGYAEPAPAWRVSTPFAWWALADRTDPGVIWVESGRVEYPGADRVTVQREVAKQALAHLAAYVRRWRAG